MKRVLLLAVATAVMIAMLVVGAAGSALASPQVHNNQHIVQNSNNSGEVYQNACQASQLAANCFGFIP